LYCFIDEIMSRFSKKLHRINGELTVEFIVTVAKHKKSLKINFLLFKSLFTGIYIEKTISWNIKRM